jgi:hypothetical protein
MRQKISFIGVCLTVLMVVGSANAATKWLEWSFEDVVTRNFRSVIGPYDQAIVPGTTADGTGNGHTGTLDNSGISGWQPGDPLPAIMEISPYGYEVGGSAIHFRADDTIQRVRAFPVIEPNTFSTGITMRAVWQFDEEAPASSRFTLMQQGGPGWQHDTMEVNWDNYGTEYLGIACMVAGGIRYTIAAKRNIIEAEIGHSMIGNPLVVTGTYDGTTLALYVDGILVASETYVASIAPGDGYDRVEIGNDGGSGNNSSRKSIVDEVCIWQGALTATEVMCDYGSVVGEPTCCADIIAAGGGDVSDLNEDCIVNFGDFVIFIDGWADCTPGYNCP